MMEKYLTPLEASQILKVKKPTVYEMIKRGDLKATKMGKQFRIAESEITRLMGHADIPRKNTSAALLSQSSGISVCGQDMILDILCTRVKGKMPEAMLFRSFLGSYNGLYAMYQGQATIASAHLWDMETDTYNIPFISKLLPGEDIAVYHIAKRDIGIYVAKGNPKKIMGILDFSRSDVTIANREKGSGIRVLTDSLLLKNKIPTDKVNGYKDIVNSHVEAAMAVSSGKADCAFGNRIAVKQVGNLDFIPVKQESYDIAIRCSDLNIPEVQCIIETLSDPAYIGEISALEGYDVSGIGERIL